jgi:hypothetical protein
MGAERWRVDTRALAGFIYTWVFNNTKGSILVAILARG